MLALKRSADRGDADIQSNHGLGLYKEEDEKDLREAVRYFKMRGGQGHSYGQDSDDACVLQGEETENCLTGIPIICKLLADNGIALSQYLYGVRLFTGEGVEKDLRNAGQ
jgi:TPR repeat protein